MEAVRLSGGSHDIGKVPFRFSEKSYYSMLILKCVKVCFQELFLSQVVVIGTMIGSPLCGHVSDKYGRKAVSLISGFFIYDLLFFVHDLIFNVCVFCICLCVNRV